MSLILTTILLILPLLMLASQSAFAANLVFNKGTRMQIKTDVSSCRLFAPEGRDFESLQLKGYELIQSDKIVVRKMGGPLNYPIVTQIDFANLNLQNGDLYLEASGVVTNTLIGWSMPQTNVFLMKVVNGRTQAIEVSSLRSVIALPKDQIFNISNLPDCEK